MEMSRANKEEQIVYCTVNFVLIDIEIESYSLSLTV